MTRAILKYPLTARTDDVIPWDDSSRITLVAAQYDAHRPTVWVDQPIVNSRGPQQKVRRFQYIGTGSTYDDTVWECVGTMKIDDGYLMWHVLASWKTFLSDPHAKVSS